MADPRLASRVLVAGIALALVVGASGEGCDNDESFFSFGSAVTEAVVAKGELAEDMESARRIAQAVAEFEDGTCTEAKSGRGYKVTVLLGEGGRVILVRVMARGGERANYYRVVIPEKGAVNKDGVPAGRAESHHEITDFAIDEILEIIDKSRKRERQ